MVDADRRCRHGFRRRDGGRRRRRIHRRQRRPTRALLERGGGAGRCRRRCAALCPAAGDHRSAGGGGGPGGRAGGGHRRGLGVVADVPHEARPAGPVGRADQCRDRRTHRGHPVRTAGGGGQPFGRGDGPPPRRIGPRRRPHLRGRGGGPGCPRRTGHLGRRTGADIGPAGRGPGPGVGTGAQPPGAGGLGLPRSPHPAGRGPGHGRGARGPGRRGPRNGGPLLRHHAAGDRPPRRPRERPVRALPHPVRHPGARHRVGSPRRAGRRRRSRRRHRRRGQGDRPAGRDRRALAGRGVVDARNGPGGAQPARQRHPPHAPGRRHRDHRRPRRERRGGRGVGPGRLRRDPRTGARLGLRDGLPRRRRPNPGGRRRRARSGRCPGPGRGPPRRDPGSQRGSGLPLHRPPAAAPVVTPMSRLMALGT